MVNIEGHEVKIWKGSRAAYDAIPSKNNWVRYIVTEANGSIREYYGNQQINNNVDAGEF